MSHQRNRSNLTKYLHQYKVGCDRSGFQYMNWEVSLEFNRYIIAKCQQDKVDFTYLDEVEYYSRAPSRPFSANILKVEYTDNVPPQS